MRLREVSSKMLSASTLVPPICAPMLILLGIETEYSKPYENGDEMHTDSPDLRRHDRHMVFGAGACS